MNFYLLAFSSSNLWKFYTISTYMLSVDYIEIKLQIRRKETKYLSSVSLGQRTDLFSLFRDGLTTGNDIIKPINFSASLSHNKQNKKPMVEHDFPTTSAWRTFTNFLAVEGDRNQKLESRDTKKACPYQCFFSCLVSKEQVLGQSMSWCKLM